jgi:RimJ/RimL family protein N-acetyltransferase
VTVLLHALLLEIPEKLESERLTLAAARAGQGAAVNEAVVESIPELKPWMPWAQEPPTLEESEKVCREGQAKWVAREMLDFCFFDKGDGCLVGKGGLHTIDWAVPRFEIGYWIRTSRTRKGFATEATKMLVEFAHSLGAHRVEITCNGANAASRRVAEKSGFALEAILRNHRRTTDGTLADTCMYARVF